VTSENRRDGNVNEKPLMQKERKKHKQCILISVARHLYDNDFKFSSQNKNSLKRTCGKAKSEVRSLSD